MKNYMFPDEDDSEPLIPDLAVNLRTAFMIEINHSAMSRDEALHLLRLLNAQQFAIFYKVWKWCLEKVL